VAELTRGGQLAFPHDPLQPIAATLDPVLVFAAFYREKSDDLPYLLGVLNTAGPYGIEECLCRIGTGGPGDVNGIADPVPVSHVALSPPLL
jgi:hypothetical protein